MTPHSAPFYIGAVNIFDYQAQTGYVRWNTLQASLTTSETSPSVFRVMDDLGIDLMQAQRHIQQRNFLRARQQVRELTR
jgi:hypothetical protein